MSLPLLAVDVDGVIVLMGEEDLGTRTATRFELIDGMMHRVSLAAGDRLRQLTERYELVWATGWEKRANEHFPRLLGLPELPHVSFNGKARFGSAHWKLGPLDDFSRGRPVAWVDDNFDDACHSWASERAAPTLLVPVDPRRGLEEDHVETLLAWAQALG